MLLAALLYQMKNELSLPLVFATFLIYLIPFCFELLLILHLPREVARGHEWLRTRVFCRVIESGECPISIVTVAGLMLNLSFVTLVCMLPLRELLSAIFPLFRPAESLLPTSYVEILRKFEDVQVWSVLVIATCGPGPFLILLSRWLGLKRAVRPRRVFESLQVVFYFSVILAVLCLVYGTAPSGTPLEVYRNILVVVLLPGTLAGVALMLVFQKDILQVGIVYG